MEDGLVSGLVLTDAAGKAHPAAGTDARIACFVPSITELCFDLGLGGRLVARTQYCIHPADTVEHVPAVGGTKKVSLPKLRRIAPSHVILNVDENTEEMAAALGEFVPHVIVTHPLRPDDNLELYALLGSIFGVEEKAKEIAANYREAASALRTTADSLPPRDVIYFIWREPWMTVSRDTYISALLREAGWRTLLHDPGTRYPEVDVTPELIAETDLFLFSSEPFEFTQTHVDAFAAAYDCPRDKLLFIDGEYCSWYGSRAVAGLRYLKTLAEEIARR